MQITGKTMGDVKLSVVYEMLNEGNPQSPNSGKTIVDHYLNNNYDFFYQKAFSICKKDKDMASELYHHSIEQLYLYYDLSKLTNTVQTEKRLFYYITNIINTQFFTWKSSFNKKFRYHPSEELPFNIIDNPDDFELNKEEQERYELQLSCMYGGIDELNIQPEHKKQFYKFMFREIVFKKKNPNMIAKELGVSNGTIYSNYRDLKSKLKELYDKKCQFI